MRSRPKSVIIDGIHYAPIDVTDATALSADLRGKRALRLQSEVKRLRDGIKKYCHVTENALEMWEHEDAYASLKALIDEQI